MRTILRNIRYIPENFGSSLVGITETDFRALNAEMENPVDEEAFFKRKDMYFIQKGIVWVEREGAAWKTDPMCGIYTSG